MENIIFILEIIGSVAFAMSGAILGIKKKFDIFGIMILGAITTVGGGVLRDIVIGVTPPVMFTNPIYCLIAAVVSLVICIPAVYRLLLNRIFYNIFMVLMDSAGLAAFTVTGVAHAYKICGGENVFLLVFTGVITGIGGGIIRDLLAGEQPYVFKKHIYACASIAGAILCAILLSQISFGTAILISMVVIMVIRIIAAYFKINLPKPKIEL